MTMMSIQIEQQTSFLGNVIYANASTVKKLNLPLYRPFELSFGNKKVNVSLGYSNNKGNLLRIPQYVASSLGLPNGIQLHGKYNSKNETLSLGPVLGILVQTIAYNQSKSPFGKFTPFAEEVSLKARSKGVFPYFFMINDINQDEGKITGLILKDNKWKKSTFPIPDIIYNRLSSRRYEKKVKPIINQFKEKYQFIFFNDHFLNKWDVYQMLNQTPVKSIIPKTVLYRGNKTIKEMINNYPVIYLKPTNGSLGIGIIRISKKNNQIEVMHTRAQGTTILNFSTYEKMYKYLVPRLSSQQYLVQQGLNLISLDKRPIDFRILAQKNEYKKWSITSMVSRIANDKHFVSNLAQGGTQSNVFETIKLARPDLIKRITRKIFSNYALKIASKVENLSSGHFAEFGIDLALDENGKIWLLEVNAKPSKNDDTKNPKEPRPSVTRLINYVLVVSDFKTVKKKKNN